MKFAHSICVVLFACVANFSAAHEGPSQIIQRLSHRIDSGRGHAEDYQRRAVEWRVLGKSDRAARDLRLALRRDPDYQPAWRELARVSLALNDPVGAVAAARRALELSEAEGTRNLSTTPQLLLAEILLDTGDAAAARVVIEKACSLNPDQGVDTWWLRAEILAQLGGERSRIECLRAGWQQTGSEALRISWIDAVIESGDGPVVISEVEDSLNRCRLKAAWRIRRARISIGCDKPVEAKADLLKAITELEGRLHPIRPDRGVEQDLADARRLLALSERRAAKNR